MNNQQANDIVGGLRYNEPVGWEKFGLKVLNIYDDGNDSWIKDKNKIKQWSTVYHAFKLVPTFLEGET